MSTPLNPNTCQELVFPTTGGYTPKQYKRPKGQGEGGQFCSTHAQNSKNITGQMAKRNVKERLWR